MKAGGGKDGGTDQARRLAASQVGNEGLVTGTGEKTAGSVHTCRIDWLGGGICAGAAVLQRARNRQRSFLIRGAHAARVWVAASRCNDLLCAEPAAEDARASLAARRQVR